MKFRKHFTNLCELPWMIIPIVGVGWLSARIATGSHDLLEIAARIRVISITQLVGFACGVTIKFIYYKDRPKPQAYHNRRQKIDASSFPSIHTARATIFMCFGLLLSYILYHQHGQQMTMGNLILIITSLVFYLMIAYSRIILKKHFFIDVVFGTLLGLVTVAFSWIHLDAIAAGFTLVSGRFSFL